ncbi:MAG: LysR family transcriptional regulator [Pseudomonadota bacterium]
MTDFSAPPPPLSVLALTDRIELMSTFIRIVEAGSMSAAARQLGASQPTVSRRLQLLERSLGLRLLHRSTHAMKLTEDGARCFERAKHLLAEWAAFEADLRGVGSEPEGRLRVVAPHAFGQQHLVGPLVQFMRRHPRVTVDWLLHDGAPDFLGQGIDCAIQVGPVRDPALVAIRVAEVPRIVVAAPGLLAGAAPPAQAAELAHWPWLALQQYYLKEVVLTHMTSGATCRHQFQPRLTTDSLYALRSAALLGLGICVASAWLLADDLASGKLVHLTPEWQAASLPVYIVYPYSNFYPAKLRRFVDTMRTAMPGAMGAAISGHAVLDGKVL